MAKRPEPKAPNIGNIKMFVEKLSNLSRVTIPTESRRKRMIDQLIPPQRPLSAVSIIKENRFNLTLQYL